MAGFVLGIAGGGFIRFQALRDYAAAVGRQDVVASLDDLAGRWLRYTNEDFDVMSRAWTALGQPRLDLATQRNDCGGHGHCRTPETLREGR